MTSAIADLTEQALSLPCEQRLRLVDRLLASLNAPDEQEIDRLWAEEVERRVDEIESGQVEPIPAEQVFAEARRRVNR